MNEVGVNRLFGERNKYAGLAASPPLCLAMRTELHFSLGSSLDLGITVEARQPLDSNRRPTPEPELLPPIWVGVDEAKGMASNPESRLSRVSCNSKLFLLTLFKMMSCMVPSD